MSTRCEPCWPLCVFDSVWIWDSRPTGRSPWGAAPSSSGLAATSRAAGESEWCSRRHASVLTELASPLDASPDPSVTMVLKDDAGCSDGQVLCRFLRSGFGWSSGRPDIDKVAELHTPTFRHSFGPFHVAHQKRDLSRQLRGRGRGFGVLTVGKTQLIWCIICASFVRLPMDVLHAM